MCRSLLIWVSGDQYGFEREGERDTAMWMRCPLDASRVVFFCVFFFTARPRRQRLIPCSPVLRMALRGWTLKAKPPINEPIICVIMWRLQLVPLMHCFSHVRSEDWKDSYSARSLWSRPLIPASILCLGTVHGRKGLAWIAYLFPPQLPFSFFFLFFFKRSMLNIKSMY